MVQTGREDLDNTMMYAVRRKETIDLETQKELDELSAQFSEGPPVDIHRVARHAVSLGCRVIVGYLVKTKQADLNRQDVAGRSAIFYAAAWTNPTMLEFMDDLPGGLSCENQCDKDIGGYTPLHYAAWADARIENIEFCLDYHADLSAEANDGETALDPARTNNDVQWAKYSELLLTPEWDWKSYQEFPALAQSFSNDFFNFKPSMEYLKGANIDIVNGLDMPHTKIIWIHIPWTNVC